MGGVEIRLLVDNRAGAGLAAEHGLSVLVSSGGRKLLLDSGAGGAIGHNAKQLGIDLSTVDTLILSHGHYDHTGGIEAVIAGRTDIAVYYHPQLFAERYSCDSQGSRSIGIPAGPAAALRALPDEALHSVIEATRLTESIGVIAPIARETEYEDPGGPFFLDAEGKIPDPIEDDLALWIRTEQGLVIVVGCCHAGIINTIGAVRRASGVERIRAIIGGLHLLHAGSHRIDQTVAALTAIAPGGLVPSHCTGEGATAALEEAFGPRVERGRSGLSWAF